MFIASGITQRKSQFLAFNSFPAGEKGRINRNRADAGILTVVFRGKILNKPGKINNLCFLA